MQKIITITVTNDLLTDRRIFKTAEYLANKGFNIKIFGRKLEKDYPPFARHPAIQVIRFRLPFNRGKTFYLYYNFILFWVLLFTRKDIMLAVDMDTVLPNFIVAKLLRKRLVFDSHEFFSELPELQHRPGTKKIWQFLEKLILPRLKHCYTVSGAIAAEYQKLYGISCQVIRNVPQIPKNSNLNPPVFPLPSNRKILIYQGVLNVGRNIEVMIEAMRYLEGFVLVIAGDGDVSGQLQELADTLKLTGQKVFFTGRIPHNQLYGLTRQAYIGLSLEQDLGKNYRYALPNKLFDYIMAQVPQIITPLPEMVQIVSQYGTGKILHTVSARNLARIINDISETEYHRMRQNCRLAAQELNWENESKKLDEFFQ